MYVPFRCRAARVADASTLMRGKDVLVEDLAAVNPTAVGTAVHMAAEDDSIGSEQSVWLCVPAETLRAPPPSSSYHTCN